jgi:hypothetical protein
MTRSSDLADPVLVRAMLSRYVPVKLDVALEQLAEPDRRALHKLTEAATWIDRIYWRQRSAGGWELRQRVSGMPGDEARQLERLLDINFGPWDALSDDQPFCGGLPRPPGANFYPPDLTRPELERYLAEHPNQRRSLLSHTTLVRRDGAGLVAVAYEDAFRQELTQAAQALVEASGLVTHAGFREFLRARASGLVDGDLARSETRWVGVGDSPIDIAIGPYEVYDDQLMGVKASYEATILVRHPMTEHVAQFEAVASDLEAQLAGAVAPSRNRRKFVVGVYDVACAAGLTNMGSKAIAATLPNDERIRSEVGARLLLFRNVIVAKFAPLIVPLSVRLLRPEQAALVREDALVAHTVLHELAHAVGTDFVMDGGATTGTTINEALRERYAILEECRADVLGLVFLDFLARRGTLPFDMRATGAVTFAVTAIRALRFGAYDDHGRAAAMTLSHLMNRKALRLDATDTLLVDIDRLHAGAAELAAEVHGVTTRGDYTAAGALIEALASVPAPLTRLPSRLTDLPVDVEFVFDPSLRLR